MTHPAHIKDVAAAVRWVYDHAAEFGGSPKKIVIMGHSAGCHLVTLLALDPRYLAGVRLRPSDLSGVVAWSGGAYDLVAKVREGAATPPISNRRLAIRKRPGAMPPQWPTSPTASRCRLSCSSRSARQCLEPGRREAGRYDPGREGPRASKLIEGRNHATAIALVGAPNDTTGRLLLDFIRETTQ